MCCTCSFTRDLQPRPNPTPVPLLSLSGSSGNDRDMADCRNYKVQHSHFTAKQTICCLAASSGRAEPWTTAISAPPAASRVSSTARDVRPSDVGAQTCRSSHGKAWGSTKNTWYHELIQIALSKGKKECLWFLRFKKQWANALEDSSVTAVTRAKIFVCLVQWLMSA